MAKDTINIVTSFNPKGWETYAKKMIESANKFLSDDLHLTAYYHDFDDKTIKQFPKSKNITFKKDEFINHIESNPNSISPNVILRPLYQESILPNLAYVGGGSEISYCLTSP